MGRINKVMSVLMSTLLFMLGTATLYAKQPELLFYAPYDGSVNAQVARGKAEGTVIPNADPNPTPVFEPGLRGQALEIGKSVITVIYKPDGNVLNERGTISFWARRVGELPKEQPYTYNLMGWSGNEKWVTIYKWGWYEGVALLRGKGPAGEESVRLPGGDDDGKWHFFTFTWDGQHVTAYQDGIRHGEDYKFELPNFVELRVGGGGICRRLFDELKIYDEPLGIAEIKQMYKEGIGVRNEPFLTIPRRINDIRIDGNISQKEWQGTVETTGLCEIDKMQVGPTPTRFRLTYDDEALYISATSELNESVRADPAMTAGIKGMLLQTRTQFDSDVDSDDALEINLRPKGLNGDWYRLVVNGLNTHYDYKISHDKDSQSGSGGVIHLAWNPKWESASTLDMAGWHVEMRIPFTELGVDTPKPGEEWGLNLIRVWQSMQSGREAWALGPTGTPGYSYETSPVRFGAVDEMSVALRQWGLPFDGLLDVIGEVSNPTTATRSVHIKLETDSNEVHQVETVTVPPKGQHPIQFKKQLYDANTSMVTFEINNADNQQLMFRSRIPITMRQVLEIKTAHYPTAGIFKGSFDVGRLRDVPLEQLGIWMTIIDGTDKPVIGPKRLRPLPGYTCTMEMDVSKLPVGKYNVECGVERFHSDAGESQPKVVAKKVVPYEKQPLPVWYGNKIGITDKAPKPFEPVVLQDDTIKCWGREYRYGRRLFPEQIITQGNEILAGPIELVLTDAKGQKHSSTASEAQSTWGKHTDFRLEYTRAIVLAGVKMETACWIECDGFLWTRLTVSGSAEDIHSLVVRIPYRKEWSEYINTADYSIVTTGKLKSEGFKSDIGPIWLGNGIGGMQWVAETMAPCRVSEGTAIAQVIPQTNRTILEITLINVPSLLKKPLSVEWGIVPTPVRPPTSGYRSWLTDNSDYYPSYIAYPPNQEFNPRWEVGGGFIGIKKRPDGKGNATVSSGPYVVTSVCAPSLPEYTYWGDEWSVSGKGRKDKPGFAEVSPGCQSWEDFFVWCYRQLYDRNRFIGLYYDCQPMPMDDNVYHGGGYYDGQKTIPVPTILGARRLSQRLYVMLRELEPDHTFITFHLSGMPYMAYLSWCDVYVDGENFTSKLNKQEQDYHRVFPPEAFLAQSMGHNFGLTNWFLDQFNRSGATSPEDWKRLGTQPVTHLYGMVLLHDSGYWKAYGIPAGYEMVDEALRKYNWDDRYRMIPYWDQKIVTLPEKVYATFYRDDKSGRVIMILLNNNEQNLTLHLNIDWVALGFTDWRRLKVDDAVFKEGARIEDGQLVTPVGAVNMRFLVFEE